MKTGSILPSDYFSACLDRLEESRGHIISEAEYRALRRETLEELAAHVRAPSAVRPILGAVTLGCVGAITLIAPGIHSGWRFGLAVCAILCAILCAITFVAKARRRKSLPSWSAKDRLAALRLLRNQERVTPEEFSSLTERIELPRAA